MYTYESGKRPQHPDDAAIDHLAARTRAAVSQEQWDTTVEVLRVMAGLELDDLWGRVTVDGMGNPVCDTDEQRLAHSTWSSARQDQRWLDRLIDAMEHQE